MDRYELKWIYAINISLHCRFQKMYRKPKKLSTYFFTAGIPDKDDKLP